MYGTAPWTTWHHLPHFTMADTTHTVTFRLADSLARETLDAWHIELRELPAPAVKRELRSRIDRHLDRGLGDAWLRDPRVAAVVQEALLRFDGVRYRLLAWVVMPNHVHVVLTPWEPLHGIVHAWKSFTANRANEILGRKGAFWQRDYFDRYVRDLQHYLAVLNYVEENPVKAGLCRSRERWPWSSASVWGTRERRPA